MHGDAAFVAAYADALRGADLAADVDVLLFPPVAYLMLLRRALVDTRVEIGAQNLHTERQGAFTGEVVGEMIRDLGGAWALVGHSERRHLFGETDALVARKFAAALRAELRPVLCLGETLEERSAGTAEAVVNRQLEAVIDTVDVAGLARGIVAYEPVWAIGTGETATPAQAQEMHQVIRRRLHGVSPGLADEIRILYGGSVKPDNAAELFAQADIDGGLVGGASLEIGDFLAIVACASRRA
jgi:triosephosphate isomerase